MGNQWAGLSPQATVQAYRQQPHAPVSPRRAQLSAYASQCVHTVQGVAASMERTGSWGHDKQSRMTFVGTPCWCVCWGGSQQLFSAVWGVRDLISSYV